jgi:hypothetical protein
MSFVTQSLSSLDFAHLPASFSISPDKPRDVSHKSPRLRDKPLRLPDKLSDFSTTRPISAIRRARKIEDNSGMMVQAASERQRNEGKIESLASRIALTSFLSLAKMP